MKAKTINIQLVKNLGNFESARFGGEWELNGESLEEAIAAALKELRAAMAGALNEGKKSAEGEEQGAKTPAPEKQAKTPAEVDGKQVVRFGDPICQQIVKRVQDTDTDIETVKRYYALDKEAERVIAAAIQLRPKQTN